jgi:hypothetical protein
MNIEISPMIEYANQIVISSVVACGDGGACIGKKKFIENGKLEYEWFLEYLTRDDLLALADALTFVADHMVIVPRCEGVTA